MLPCVTVPDLARFDWPAARLPEFLETRPSMSVTIPEGGPPAEPLSNWEDRGPAVTSAGVPFAQVQPRPLCPAVGGHGGVSGTLGRKDQQSGAPRQKARWPIPDMCLVPPAGLVATAMTEPRGVATEEGRSSLEVQPFKTAVRQVGNSGWCALTLVSIYVFGGETQPDLRLGKCFLQCKVLTAFGTSRCAE